MSLLRVSFPIKSPSLGLIIGTLPYIDVRGFEFL